MKKCSRCGLLKDESEFELNSYKRKDGSRSFANRCKECARAYSRKYRAEHLQELTKKDRVYKQKQRVENPEADRKYKREYYTQHRDYFKTLRKKYAAQHRFEYALKDSASRAAKFGYRPCNATPAELQEAFTGRCAVCGVPETELAHRLHVDHCHETGCFRGHLCSNCNRALGHFKDNKEVLKIAIQYLEQSIRKESIDGLAIERDR
jgi:hypothetical protein